MRELCQIQSPFLAEHLDEYANAVVSLTIPADKTLLDDRATNKAMKVADIIKGTRTSTGYPMKLFHGFANFGNN